MHRRRDCLGFGREGPKATRTCISTQPCSLFRLDPARTALHSVLDYSSSAFARTSIRPKA